jgi:hypothetical protein
MNDVKYLHEKPKWTTRTFMRETLLPIQALSRSGCCCRTKPPAKRARITSSTRLLYSHRRDFRRDDRKMILPMLTGARAAVAIAICRVSDRTIGSGSRTIRSLRLTLDYTSVNCMTSENSMSSSIKGWSKSCFRNYRHSAETARSVRQSICKFPDDLYY